MTIGWIAAGVTLQKPAVATTPALTVTWLSCTVGVVVCLPFAPELAADLVTAPPSAIAWLIFLGLFPTAVAFTIWAYALGRTTAGRLGSTTYLVPAVPIVLGWLLLGESPAPLALAGGVVAIVGVVIARWAPSRRTAVAEPANRPPDGEPRAVGSGLRRQRRPLAVEHRVVELVGPFTLDELVLDQVRLATHPETFHQPR